VKVAAPNFPTISTTVKMRIVLMGMAIIAYDPGSGAGIKAVVTVANEEAQPKTAITAMPFTEKCLFFIGFQPDFQLVWLCWIPLPFRT
jgi:hypothetical protein